MNKYIVQNDTDGIPASEFPFDTKEEATDFIERFRKRFKQMQGNYLTSRQERINPAEINQTIEKIDA